jgi:hypothetical protein
MYVNLAVYVFIRVLIELLVSVEWTMSLFSPQVKTLFLHPWKTLSCRRHLSVVLSSLDEEEIKLECFSNLGLACKSMTWSSLGIKYGVFNLLYIFNIDGFIGYGLGWL